MSSMNGLDIKRVLLEVVNECVTKGGSFQQSSTLRDAAMKLGIRGTQDEEALLTVWYDLFRQGILSWGSNLANPDPPFCHLTETGNAILKHRSRDPYNPQGYIEYLDSLCSLIPITHAYIMEALDTFNSSCFKATSLLVGVAAEAELLDLRDCIVNKILSKGGNPNRNLTDWKIKAVLHQVSESLIARKSDIPKDLYEKYEAHFSSFVAQIRLSRNDAGHPVDLNSATQESAYASLLIFPDLSIMIYELKEWITNHY